MNNIIIRFASKAEAQELSAMHPTSGRSWAQTPNTDYVNSPEECLAVNFSYAIIFGLDRDYYTPQLIKSMLEILKG